MKGLKISVTNSDLVMKREEKIIKLFVMFKDNKYGTKYVIFTDSDNKKLYFGNPLVKKDKMVIMKFKNIADEEMVKEFTWKVIANDITSNFEVIEIPKITKLELIDYNTLDVKDEFLTKLNDMYFKKEEVVSTTNNVVDTPKKKKSILPMLIMLITILGGFFAFTYFRNNPHLIYGNDIYVKCVKKLDIEGLNTKNDELLYFTFNNSRDILKKHEKELTYKFSNNDEYYNFKEKNLYYKYVNQESNVKGSFKFIDEELTFKYFADYDLVNNYNLPKKYDDIFDHYNKAGYSCSIVDNK